MKSNAKFKNNVSQDQLDQFPIFQTKCHTAMKNPVVKIGVKIIADKNPNLTKYRRNRKRSHVTK